MTEIRLGTNVVTGKPATMTLPSEGNIPHLAPPRYGKTTQTKNELVQISQSGRRLIIIDYMDDEYASIGTPNFIGNYSGAVKELITIDATKFGIYPTDLDNRDLMSMKFTIPAARTVRKIIAQTGNDVEQLLRTFNDLPTDWKDMEDFSEEHPEIELDAPIFGQSKMNLIDNFTALMEKGFFVSQEENETYEYTQGMQGRKRLTQDFINQLLRKGNLRLNLNMNDVSENISQFYVGKILQVMRQRKSCHSCYGCEFLNRCIRRKPSTLELFHPIIVVEEADKAFPRVDSKIPETERPISLQEGREYVLKQQRRGFVFFINSQKPELLNDIFYEFYTEGIHGRFKGLDPQGIAENLYWNKEKNERHFVHVAQGSPFYTIFSPDPIMCYDVKRFKNGISKAFREETPKGLQYNKVQLHQSDRTFHKTGREKN